jgi:D-alanine-D-alanine ligase
MNDTQKNDAEPPHLSLGKVAVVHNAVTQDADEDGEPPSLAADAEVAETAELIAQSLERQGAEVYRFAVHDNVAEVVEAIQRAGCRRVVNLVEAVGGDASREAEFPSALERARIPYTGNGIAILSAAFHKHVARRILGACNIPIPAGFEVYSEGEVPEDGYPWFVKPSRADGSIGIDQGSVVHTVEACRERVNWLLRSLGGPALLEQYLPGPEINVALLPVDDQLVGVPTAIDFSKYGAELHPIVTYNCKWVPGTPEYNARSVPALDLVPRWQVDEAVRIARAAFLTLGGSGYGRVDLRCDANGHPRVIDVNPNPDLHPEAGLSLAAQSIRLDYDTLIAFVTTGASLKETHVRSPHRASRPRAARGAAWAY